MPSNKKHHFVPRFYLDRFSNEKRRINLFHIPSERIVLGASARCQCCRDYFYGKSQVVERTLSRIEGKAAEILNRISEHQYVPEAWSPDHQAILLFMLIQHGRTAYSADMLNERADALFRKAMLPYMDTKGINTDLVRFGSSEPGHYALSNTIAHYPIIFDLQLKLLTVTSDHEFVTSDNPVVPYNQQFEFKMFGSNTGLACKGLQLFFPIDPKNLLLLYDPRVYSVGKRGEQVVCLESEYDVMQINVLQFVSAQQSIFFRNPTFDIAQLHKRAFPYYRKEKSRIDVFGPKGDVQGEQLIVTTNVDVKTNLRLSFMRIVKREQLWVRDLRKHKRIPAGIARNQHFVEEHHAFLECVEKGECGIGEFPQWYEMRVNQATQQTGAAGG